jgi:outer membrane protein assembly factor BamE
MRRYPLRSHSMRILVLVLAATLSAGCNFVHRIDVQQGNFVTTDVASKLKVGMTRTEVRQLLGTPLLTDVFHADRWDYYFSNVKGGKPEDRTQLTVFFKDDKVASFTGNARPPGPAPVGQSTPAASQR